MNKGSKSRRILKLIFVSIVVLIAVPFFIDHLIIGNEIPSNIPNSEWTSFLGSYIGSIIGGAITVAGVWFTIQYYKEQEMRSNASEVKPVLNVWPLKGHPPKDLIISRHLNYALKEDVFIYCDDFNDEMNKDGQSIHAQEWVIFTLVIQNIGNGPVMDMELNLQTLENQYYRPTQQIGIPKNSALIYHIYIPRKFLNTSYNEKKLQFVFTDIYDFLHFEQEIGLFFDENSNTIHFGNITKPKPLKGFT